MSLSTIKKQVLMLGVALVPALLSSCEEQTSTVRVREYEAMVLEPTSRKLSSVYSASIRGKQDIDIRPKVSGYITEVCVREGALVQKGQTLFVIDQVPYQAELQTAIANVDVAQAAVDAAELTTGSTFATSDGNLSPSAHLLTKPLMTATNNICTMQTIKMTFCRLFFFIVLSFLFLLQM